MQVRVSVSKRHKEAISAKDLWRLIKDAALAWNEDGAASMGAAIAYYTIFSIAPLLIIAMAVAGFFFGADAAQGHVYAQARGLVGEEGALALQALVESASQPAESMFATVTGLAVMALGATGVFAELQGAMDRIWQVPASKQQSGLWYMVRRRMLTFGMVLGVAFILLVSLIVSALISALESLWSPYLGGFEAAAARLRGLGRRADRGCRHRLAVQYRQVSDRPLYRQERRRLGIRSGRNADRPVTVGLLLGADFPARCRIYLGLCRALRVTSALDREGSPPQLELPGSRR